MSNAKITGLNTLDPETRNNLMKYLDEHDNDWTNDEGIQKRPETGWLERLKEKDPEAYKNILEEFNLVEKDTSTASNKARTAPAATTSQQSGSSRPSLQSTLAPQQPQSMSQPPSAISSRLGSSFDDAIFIQ